MQAGRCNARILLTTVTAMLIFSFALGGCGTAHVRLTYDSGETNNGNGSAISRDNSVVKSTNTALVDSEKTMGKDSDEVSCVEIETSDEYERYAEINDLGYKYQLGLEVECDYYKAVECYREAAEYGIPEAMTNLGYCYERGLGVEIDYERAVELYRKGATLGDSTAMNNLGWCYERGLGVKQDYKTAYEWYSASAKNGNTTGYENMMFLENNGLIK